MMYSVHPIAAMLKESHFYRYNKFEIESPLYEEDEGFGWWKLLEDTPYTTGEEKLAGWNSADDAEKGREKAEEEQYHQMCDNDCCTMLTKDTPIMCYKTDTKEMTLCSTCYWEAGFWEDDENSDNEDEIEAHKEGEGEEELCWCKVGIKECDCDKCGRCGCYECVSGGHGENEDENWCEECEAE